VLCQLSYGPRQFSVPRCERGLRHAVCKPSQCVVLGRPRISQNTRAPCVRALLGFRRPRVTAPATGNAAHDTGVRRRSLGALFAVLSASFLAIGAYAALQGGSAWVIALACAALGAWMGELAFRAFRS
jgi:hypothetical protein